MEIINNNLFGNAAQLADQGYAELSKTHNTFSECNCVFVNHTNQTFWFTTLQTANHTLSVAKSKIAS